jgi:HNH endonuclease
MRRPAGWPTPLRTWSIVSFLKFRSASGFFPSRFHCVIVSPTMPVWLEMSCISCCGRYPAPFAVAVFQVIAVSFTKYEASHATRNADAIFEEYLDLLSVDSRWVDSVSKSTGDTERIKYAFETWNNRLEAVMRASQSNNKTRCFSLALKKEMFTQSPVCAICKQQIRLVNDAALDHEQHYWRGGRTVPENARLVHRVCNLGRPL